MHPLAWSADENRSSGVVKGEKAITLSSRPSSGAWHHRQVVCLFEVPCARTTITWAKDRSWFPEWSGDAAAEIEATSIRDTNTDMQADGFIFVTGSAVLCSDCSSVRQL